jgi:hypothetical protein
MIPLHWGQDFDVFLRRRKIGKELKVLLVKRGQAIRKLRDALGPDAVVPFLRNPLIRMLRIRRVKKEQRRIRRQAERQKRKKINMNLKREKVF